VIAVAAVLAEHRDDVVAEPRRRHTGGEPSSGGLDLLGPPAGEDDVGRDLLEPVPVATCRSRRHLDEATAEAGDQTGGTGDVAQERHDTVPRGQRAIDIERGDAGSLRHGTTSCQPTRAGGHLP
jgi:hypothetical protein